ncbi:MAG: SCP2 sterol-binding domain-containing protein [Motiliproteus sp.]|nr:SCP2 sterol-binding domain-containing protein [Motiliproteus sp.]MCW9051970.1 SCP2 sterol-binding domain-containing protein [Motiliproteus sp.]
MTTDNHFEQMLNRFDPAAAGSLDVVFQYQIEDLGAYHFIVKDQNCVLGSGEHEAPSVTLKMNEETLVNILDGETDGMAAFMTGQLKATGDLMLATRLPQLFPAA